MAEAAVDSLDGTIATDVMVESLGIIVEQPQKQSSDVRS